MTFSESELRHRFSVWAAGRASGRSSKKGVTGLKISDFRTTFEASGVRYDLQQAVLRTDWTAVSFDIFHRSCIDKLLKHRTGTSLNVGRLAKFLNVYIKASYILAGHAHTDFGTHAHPPVDDAVLKAAVALNKINPIPALRNKWTQIEDYENYALIIDALRLTYAGQPLWFAEQDWTGQAN